MNETEKYSIKSDIELIKKAWFNMLKCSDQSEEMVHELGKVGASYDEVTRKDVVKCIDYSMDMDRTILKMTDSMKGYLVGPRGTINQNIYNVQYEEFHGMLCDYAENYAKACEFYDLFYNLYDKVAQKNYVKSYPYMLDKGVEIDTKIKLDTSGSGVILAMSREERIKISSDVKFIKKSVFNITRCSEQLLQMTKELENIVDICDVYTKDDIIDAIDYACYMNKKIVNMHNDMKGLLNLDGVERSIYRLPYGEFRRMFANYMSDYKNAYKFYTLSYDIYAEIVKEGVVSPVPRYLDETEHKEEGKIFNFADPAPWLPTTPVPFSDTTDLQKCPLSESIIEMYTQRYKNAAALSSKIKYGDDKEFLENSAKPSKPVETPPTPKSPESTPSNKSDVSIDSSTSNDAPTEVVDAMTNIPQSSTISKATTVAPVQNPAVPHEEENTKSTSQTPVEIPTQNNATEKTSVDTVKRQKSLVLAVILNIFLPGIGYFYAGKKAGLVIFIVALIFCWTVFVPIVAILVSIALSVSLLSKQSSSC